MADSETQEEPKQEELSQLRQFLKDGEVTKILVKSDGKVTETDLKDCDFLDGYCAIYFSAHWCPPCRGFTPKLAQKYEELQKKGLTILFLSSDRDEASFNEYFNEMPWHAIPYGHKDKLGRSSAFKQPSGIPSMYIFNKGELYQKEGRGAVMTKEFPWEDKKFAWDDVLANVITGFDGDKPTKIDEEGLEKLKSHPNVAFYFSAHWCGPCRGFTPELVKTYNEMKKTRSDFEFIFVSGDRDEAAFKEYFGEMPFMALDFTSDTFKDMEDYLSKLCEVRGIPSLAVFAQGGKLENSSARGFAGADPKGEMWPWYFPVYDLEQSIEGINDTLSVVLMMDEQDEAKQQELQKILTEHAQPHFEQRPKRKLLHFTSKDKESQIGTRIKTLTQANGSQMVLLDIPNYYVTDLPESTAAIEELHQKFLKKELEMKTFS